MKKIKHPSEDAFFTNPVASVTDRTGFAVTVPETELQAREISDMFGNIPLTSHRSTRRNCHSSKNKPPCGNKSNKCRKQAVNKL